MKKPNIIHSDVTVQERPINFNAKNTSAVITIAEIVAFVTTKDTATIEMKMMHIVPWTWNYYHHHLIVKHAVLTLLFFRSLPTKPYVEIERKNGSFGGGYDE